MLKPVMNGALRLRKIAPRNGAFFIYFTVEDFLNLQLYPP